MLRVVSSCFNSTIPRAQFFLLLVTSTSNLPVRTIRLCSVVFGVTSSIAVIHTIHGRPCMCIARDRAWSVSRCTQSWTTVTVYSSLFTIHGRSKMIVTAGPTAHRAWSYNTCSGAYNRKPVAKCKIQTRVQQLLIAIRSESKF